MLTASQRTASARPKPDSPVAEPSVVAIDRRGADRKTSPCHVKVAALGAAESQLCTADDISENGLYVRIPQSTGLRVGQRCEVELFADGSADAPAETCYATVIRTDVLDTNAGDQIGAGLRFDQPLYL